MRQFFQAPGDQPGGGDTTAKVLDLATKSHENAAAALEATKANTEEIAKTAAAVEEAKADLERAETAFGHKIGELRTLLETQHGPSGAQDWFNVAGKWLRGAYHHKRTGVVPSDCKIEGYDFQKAVADFTTSTSATAGYTVPDLMLPGILAGKDIYGQLIPRCYRLTVPGGQTMKVPAESTTASGFWRKTQGAAMSEDEFVYAQGSVNPVLVGSYIKAANELLEVPGTGFAENAIKQMLRAIVKKEETGMVQGDSDALGTALDPPSDGILVDTGVTDQTNISASTLAALVTFISESVADNDELLDTGEAVLLLHPSKVMALAAQAISATNLPGALTWADARNGIPGKILGYDYIMHHATLVSATYWAAMFRPMDIVYANSGKIAVDFNDRGDTAWTSNETWIRVMTHTDWALPRAAKISKADYA